MATDTPVPPGVDPTKPNVGRMYDLVLGGTNYFEADVKAVEAIRKPGAAPLPRSRAERCACLTRRRAYEKRRRA